MYTFIDSETKETLSIMPQGSWQDAKEEQERLMEELDCLVSIIEEQ